MEPNINVLLHLGYPKTASSSLQFGIFDDLNRQKLINLQTWRHHNKDEPLEDRPSSCLFNGGKITERYITFSSKKLNILSDESFTAPVRLRRNNFGDKIIDPINFPIEIKKQINKKYNKVSYKVLVTLRNHSELLFSQYVEEYNLLKFKGINLLFNNKNELDLNGYDIYNYHKYIKELQRVFGLENVVISFYEDLKKNNKFFCEQLSKLLEIPVGEVEAKIKKSKFNVKQKNSFGYYTKDGDFIEKLTIQNIKKIKSHFYEDTVRLKEIPGLKEKLEKYEYL